MLSIIIPARNEADNLRDILDYFDTNLSNLDFELVLVNDFSSDETLDRAKKIFEGKSNYRVIDNDKKGLGGAISQGIKNARGERVVITMADLSDSVEDLIEYNNLMIKKNLDAVFGSRFIKGSNISNYPKLKLILNRLANNFIKIIFFSRYNDFTNAFKIYKRKVLLKLLPIVSESFNVFLELPLKIITRGYRYEIIPISWSGRIHGNSKFNRQLSSIVPSCS